MESCKCYPGFDSTNKCAPCQDQDEEQCWDYRFNCDDPSFSVNCRKTCMVGSCYVPASQTACEVNKCYGRGICTTRGTCIMCMTGYSGAYCEISLISNPVDYGDDYSFNWNY